MIEMKRIVKVNKNNCIRCGKCCVKYSGTLMATDEDLKRWKEEGRYDILKHISNGDLWFKFENGEEKECSGRCMWLRKKKNKNEYYCRINDTKPQICREYPTQQHKGCCKNEKIKIPKSSKFF